MGIQGLLPLLKDIQEKAHISKYRGLTVGIDVYCWMHKGGYGCAKDIVFKKPTKVYINYVMRRVDMLISYNITPILVFDGGHLPAKAGTETDRRKRRKEHRERGMAALKEGNIRDANEQFQRCFDITPEMAGEVIKECFSMNVQCIVAPYEADAQLAYLMKEGITQLTISEDSDLLLYGCDKVMYKMSVDGEGYVVDLANLSSVQTVQLSSFTVEKFRHMCMLSGCDYLASIKGMGLMKAFKSLRRFSNVFQCIKSLRCDKAFTVPKDYDERFRKADLVFKYQLVFDIRSKQLVRLNKVDELDTFGDAEKDFAGRKIDDQMGLQIALGNIDPISGKILAHHTDFASGDISQKAAKSASWNSPPPPKNANTAFAFHHSQQPPAASTPKNNQCVKKASQSCKVAEDATSEPAKPPTAHIEANKSLQKLKNEQVCVPTREDKIRKLYQEEEKDDVITSYETEKVTSPDAHNKDENEKGEDEKDEADQDLLAGCATFNPRHHSVFKKNHSGCKKKNRKNPFRQSNEEPSNKIVVSRFFGSKVSTDKENVNVLQVDTPSPEKGFAATHNSPTKPQLEGSFLDYLDKTNVRTCQVNQQVLTLHSPKKTCKQKKIEVLCSPKKRKRMNMFSIKNELSPVKHEQSPVKCQASNGANVDFNVTLELDEDSEYVFPTQVGSCKSEVTVNNSNCNKKVTSNNTSRKVNLKLGLCKSNTKSTLANRTNMFSHFESKTTSNMHSGGLSKKEKVSGILKSRNNVNAGSDEFCNQLNPDENALPSSLEKQKREIESHCSPSNSECVAGNDQKTKLTLGLCRNSTKRSSINNMFSNFERKTKGSIRLSKPSDNDKGVCIIKNKANDSGQSVVSNKVSNVICLDEDSNEHSTTDACVIETVKDCEEENEGCYGKEGLDVNNVKEKEKDKGKVFCHFVVEEETSSDIVKMFDGNILQSQLEGDEIEDGETDLLFNCVVGETEALVSVEDNNCDHSPPSPSESDKFHMNTVTQLGKKEGARGSGESDQLDEEPLPSHLKDEKRAVTESTIHRKEEKNDQKTMYLDEEPLPFHLDMNLDGMNPVHSSVLLAKLGKRSKPIGLSKKRKLSEGMKSDEKLKQMTFDRFVFKKKCIQRSDAVDIICLN